jgi:hypothetical protein
MDGREPPIEGRGVDDLFVLFVFVSEILRERLCSFCSRASDFRRSFFLYCFR